MKCKQCGKEKEEKLFATFRSRSGELRRRSVCWECRGEYAEENRERLTKWRKEYNKTNRSKKAERDALRRAEGKAYVDQIKTSNSCADCGGKFHPVAMDFDHGSSPKNRSVAQLVSGAYKLDLIKAEIAKCELVCANCHRVRTWTRGEHLAPTANRP